MRTAGTLRPDLQFDEDAVYSYRVTGLAVASEIELPGAIAVRDAAAADITLRAGPVPETLEQASAQGPT